MATDGTGIFEGLVSSNYTRSFGPKQKHDPDPLFLHFLGLALKQRQNPTCQINISRDPRIKRLRSVLPLPRPLQGYARQAYNAIDHSYPHRLRPGSPLCMILRGIPRRPMYNTSHCSTKDLSFFASCPCLMTKRRSIWAPSSFSLLLGSYLPWIISFVCGILLFFFSSLLNFYDIPSVLTYGLITSFTLIT